MIYESNFRNLLCSPYESHWMQFMMDGDYEALIFNMIAAGGQECLDNCLQFMDCHSQDQGGENEPENEACWYGADGTVHCQEGCWMDVNGVSHCEEPQEGPCWLNGEVGGIDCCSEMSQQCGEICLPYAICADPEQQTSDFCMGVPEFCMFECQLYAPCAGIPTGDETENCWMDENGVTHCENQEPEGEPCWMTDSGIYECIPGCWMEFGIIHCENNEPDGEPCWMSPSGT